MTKLGKGCCSRFPSRNLYKILDLTYARFRFSIILRFYLYIIHLYFVSCFLLCFPLLSYFSLFFKQITSQLLLGAEEWSRNLSFGAEDLSKVHMDFAILFTGETFSRICRRGSAGEINSEYFGIFVCLI